MADPKMSVLLAATERGGPYASFSWAADGEATPPAFETRAAGLELPRRSPI